MISSRSRSPHQIQPLVNIFKELWYDGRYVSESQPGNGKTPSAAAAGSDGILPVSLFGVQKTDFLRIRNITLSYTIPEPALKKIGNIKNVTAFTTVENLLPGPNLSVTILRAEELLPEDHR